MSVSTLNICLFVKFKHIRAVKESSALAACPLTVLSGCSDTETHTGKEKSGLWDQDSVFYHYDFKIRKSLFQNKVRGRGESWLLTCCMIKTKIYSNLVTTVHVNTLKMNTLCVVEHFVLPCYFVMIVGFTGTKRRRTPERKSASPSLLLSMSASIGVRWLHAFSRHGL